MPNARIALIARDQLYRIGLSSIVRDSEFELCASVPTPGDLRETTDEGETYDLVVVDYDPAYGEIQTVVHDLRAQYPGCRLAFIAPKTETRSLIGAFAAGVDGTLHRDCSAEAFRDSLALVLSGERVYPAFLLSMMLEGRGDLAMSPTAAAEHQRLSSREQEVLECLKIGMSNKAIANKLGITEGTVKVHMRRICRVTKTQNRTQAALWALQNAASAPTYKATSDRRRGSG